MNNKTKLEKKLGWELRKGRGHPSFFKIRCSGNKLFAIFRNARPAHETKTRSGRGFIAAAESILGLLVQIGPHSEDFRIS